MNYHIWYAGRVIESFTATNDKIALKYAKQRYTHYDKLTDDDGKELT